MTYVEVRDATPADVETLARIHAETWEATYVGSVSPVAAAEGIARARSRDWRAHTELRRRLGGDVLVLLVDGDVGGFCELGPTEDADDDPRRVGHVMRLYVLPRHHGRGGGRLLLDEACARLAAGGHECATLWTQDDESNRAHGFYSHLGWTLEDVHRDDDPDDIRYRRQLP